MIDRETLRRILSAQLATLESEDRNERLELWQLDEELLAEMMSELASMGVDLAADPRSDPQALGAMTHYVAFELGYRARLEIELQQLAA
jgi:hypothetical protein